MSILPDLSPDVHALAATHAWCDASIVPQPLAHSPIRAAHVPTQFLAALPGGITYRALLLVPGRHCRLVRQFPADSLIGIADDAAVTFDVFAIHGQVSCSCGTPEGRAGDCKHARAAVDLGFVWLTDGPTGDDPDDDDDSPLGGNNDNGPAPEDPESTPTPEPDQDDTGDDGNVDEIPDLERTYDPLWRDHEEEGRAELCSYCAGDRWLLEVIDNTPEYTACPVCNPDVPTIKRADDATDDATDDVATEAQSVPPAAHAACHVMVEPCCVVGEMEPCGPCQGHHDHGGRHYAASMASQPTTGRHYARHHARPHRPESTESTMDLWARLDRQRRDGVGGAAPGSGSLPAHAPSHVHVLARSTTIWAADQAWNSGWELGNSGYSSVMPPKGMTAGEQAAFRAGFERGLAELQSEAAWVSSQNPAWSVGDMEGMDRDSWREDARASAVGHCCLDVLEI